MTRNDDDDDERYYFDDDQNISTFKQLSKVINFPYITALYCDRSVGFLGV